MRSVFLNRWYRRVWLGQSVSQIGDYVFTMTIALWIGTVLFRDKTYAPAASAASLVIAAVVTMGAAPIAGVFVDRWDKVRVALAANAFRVLISCCFTLLPWASYSLPIWLTLTACWAGVAAQALATQFFNPARVIILSDVVSADQRGQAVGFAQASSAIAMIFGPVAAGLIFVSIGPGPSFALNGISFLCSFLAIRGVTLPTTAEPSAPVRRQHLGQEIRAPLRLIARDPLLRSTLGAGAIVMLGASTIGSLNVYFVQENLRAGPQWFGVINSSLGAGLLVGALAAPFFDERLRNRSLFVAGLLVCGVTCLIYARLDSAAAASVVIFGYGLAGGLVETVMLPLVVGAANREHLARVLAVFTSVFRLSSIISLASAGWLAALMPVGHHVRAAGLDFGRIDMILTGAAMMFLLAGVYVAVSLGVWPGRRRAAAGHGNPAGRKPVSTSIQSDFPG